MNFKLSADMCKICGMPLNYDRVTNKKTSLDPHMTLCSYCFKLQGKKKCKLKIADNTWVLNQLLKIYYSRSNPWGIISRLTSNLVHFYPDKVRTLVNVFSAVPRQRHDNEYDGVVLYSGGKDSSYMLVRLVEQNLRICAWMLNSGYQSPTAIQNAQQLCKQLRVPLFIDHPPEKKMNQLFKLGFSLGGDESIELTRAVMTFGSACWPCFATIAARATQFCDKHHVPFCFIGTQTGQNRMDLSGKPALTNNGLPRMNDLVQKFMAPFRELCQERFPEAIDLLPLSSSNKVETVVIPFYEFVSKPSIKEQLHFLSQFGWELPHDTGACSTNCMINELGRKVMRTRFGFDLYQIIEANERRIDIERGLPTSLHNPPDLDKLSIIQGAKMLGLSEAEAKEFGLEIL